MRNKRILSTILAFCMMLSMVSGAFTGAFAADSAAEIQRYEFRMVSPYHTVAGSAIRTSYAYNQVTDYSVLDALIAAYGGEGTAGGLRDTSDLHLKAYGSAPWKFGGEGSTVEGNSYTSLFSDEDGGLYISKVGDYASFIIKVEADGVYDLYSKMRITGHYGAVNAIYLAPVSEVDAAVDTIDSKYLIGKVDQYIPRSGTYGDHNVPLSKGVELSAGEYYLTYHLDKASIHNPSSQVCFVQSFTIYPQSYINETTQSKTPTFSKESSSFVKSEGMDLCIDAPDLDYTNNYQKDRVFYKFDTDYWADPSSIIYLATVAYDTATTASPVVIDSKFPSWVSAVATEKANASWANSFLPASEVVSVNMASDILYPFCTVFQYMLDGGQGSTGNWRNAEPYSAYDTWEEAYARAHKFDDWTTTNGTWTNAYNVLWGGYGEIKHSDFWLMKSAITASRDYGLYIPEVGTFEVEVNASGYYNPYIGVLANASSGIVEVFFAPVDAANPTAAEYSVGTADTYIADGSNRGWYQLGEMQWLDAGNYIMTIKKGPASENDPDGKNTYVLTAGVKLELSEQTTAPTASVDPGDYSEVQSIELICPDVGATIYYTTNGDDPTTESNVYEEPIEISETTTIKAIAVADGLVPSNIATFKYTIALSVAAPTATVAAGSYSSTQSVELKCATAGADIYYTLDGTEPTTTSTKYTGAIEISATTTIKAIAVLYNQYKSDVASYKYTIFSSTTTGKTRQSFYTAEKIAALRENIQKYSSTKTAADNYAAAAEKYVGQEERLWNLFTTQELPRSYYTTYRSDPSYTKCHYCGVDLSAKYGSASAWDFDVWNNPWKITCPDCKRDFPSNDFGSFYALGIDSNGNWSYELAKQKNAELVAAGQTGYLVNTLYPEKGAGWGVDDGYGYKTGKTVTNTSGNSVAEVHTYISYYNYWALYSGTIFPIVETLEQAYLYNGDARYGRAGAIMIDRLADLYPDYDTEPFKWQMTENATYGPNGMFTDYIWENQYAQEWARAYDSLWPMYEDAEVISFLSAKAKKYNMANDKSSAVKIRQNCEDGILREIFKEAKRGRIHGNFGMYQTSVTLAAVVLDTEGETQEMIDWVFQDGTSTLVDGQYENITGGDIQSTLINKVDRDGSSDEVAPNYTAIWVSGLTRVIDALAGYDGYPEMDMYNNPKYIRMMSYQHELLQRRKSTPAIGDSGALALDSMYTANGQILNAFKYTKNPLFAQLSYAYNGNSVNGLRYDVFTKNPDSAQQEVADVIAEYGEYDFDQSTHLTDMGFAALRDGTYYKNSSAEVDTQRAFWMFYGRSSGHGHHDALNLGIEAFGLSIAPDFGYPRGTTGDDYTNWGQSTVQHNTVLVNDKVQAGQRVGGVPFHFDDDGQVAVMDADAWHQSNGASALRRTVVMVNADEENSYGVDFFHVKGGNKHTYAFHALSDTISSTEGLTLTAQANSSGKYIGSYAGSNIAKGTVGYSNGYTYLYNVDRDATVSGGNFAVDFKITDFRNAVADEGDLHLRMQMLNGFDLSEVATANGDPAARDGNPSTIKFVLAKRSGSNLNSLFTTVFEPYENNRFIQSMQAVTVTRADGAAIGSAEQVKAVKVTLKSGRVDYIFYAQNNTVEYVVDGLFNVKGFVGVYSLQNGKNVYSYVNDGTKIGTLTGTATVTGKVTNFTKDMAFDNYIDVTINESIDPQRLVGESIYLTSTNTGTGNATYKIKGVSGTGKNLSLYVGDYTTIDSVSNGTYTYHMSNGQSFRIPLSSTASAAPVFDDIAMQTVTPGKSTSVKVSAKSADGSAVTYSANFLPDGATFDANTGTITWTPTVSHIGTHVASITANNGQLASTIQVKFNVTKPAELHVYNFFARFNVFRTGSYEGTKHSDCTAVSALRTAAATTPLIDAFNSYMSGNPTMRYYTSPLPAESEQWRVYAMKSSNDFTNNNADVGILHSSTLGGSSSSWIAFALTVNESKKYKMSSWMRFQNDNQGLIEVYLAPASDSSNRTNAKYLVETVDTYATTNLAQSREYMHDKEFDLTAGEYIVTYKMVGRSTQTGAPAQQHFGISGITFTPIGSTAVATPTATVSTGEYTAAQSVELSCATANSTIYYSINDGAWTKYNGAIEIAESATLKAYATATGYDDSAVATYTYTINIPTITGGGIVTTKSLILDGIVYVNAYVAFDDMTGVDLSKENIEKNAGIKVEMNGETYENVGTKYSGVYGGYTEYTILTNGIPAKSYGDTLTITPFIIVDGEKYYGTPSEYSVKTYCMNQINKNRATKDVCIAMLNYGAAAQAQFKHNTDTLANADLTDEQKALVWDDAYLTPVVEAADEVVGMFASTGDVNFTASSLALEGAIEVSYYNNAATTNGNERSKVMYFWTADDYNAIAAAGGTLTTENASYSVDVAAAVNEGYGYEYKTSSEGIAAKSYSDTLYAALYVVDADGDAHASGVRAYSPEAYAKRQIEKNSSATLVNLVKWITVYGEKAAAYFG